MTRVMTKSKTDGWLPHTLRSFRPVFCGWSFDLHYVGVFGSTLGEMRESKLTTANKRVPANRRPGEQADGSEEFQPDRCRRSPSPGAVAELEPWPPLTVTIMNRTLCALFILMTSLAHADWTAPLEPDPDRILKEAKSDAAARRYGDALAKHVWFHQNALRLRPSLYGVRLSFALSDWAELGAAYPPALAKLQSIRDEAARNVREGNGSRDAFHDFASINKTLGDDGKTKDLFVWLDSNKPTSATAVFDLAQPALIKAKEYRLCGRYIEPDTSFQRILHAYREHNRIARDPKFGERLREFGEKQFSNDTATLVALLVLNERKADADRIAGEAVKERDDPKFKEQLEKAKHGNVPAPWP